MKSISNNKLENNKEKIFKKIFGKINLLLYLIIVVALVFLFNRFNFRIDLTSDKIFTLSKLSKTIVKELKDPLRIKVFISKTLPPPYNEIENSLRDLLEEYAEVANDNFNFVFYDVSDKNAEKSEKIKKNIAIAEDYGISPQQIQTVEKDEVKLIKVYSGVVVEYGDLIERIPFIQSVQNLEFQLTTIFEKMNNKINSLLTLEENVKITLYLDDQFVKLAPFFNISGLDKIKDQMIDIMNTVNQQNYDRVDYDFKSILTQNDIQELKNNGIKLYPWSPFTIPNKGSYNGGVGVAAMVITVIKGDKTNKEYIELLRQESVLQLGQNGLEQVASFKLIDLENISDVVDGIIDGLLEVNDDLAYLIEKKTLSVRRQPASIFNPQGALGDAENFFNLIQNTYSIEPINLTNLSPKYKSLIIAGAKEEFSDYELFIIDQFLMSGRSIIVFHDTYYNDKLGNPMVQINRTPPQWIANNTKLDEMLKHYGVDVEKAYVLDKNSYIARSPNQSGGVKEQNIYFAPQIQAENVNHELDVISKIKNFIALEVSPVKVVAARLQAQTLKSTRLFSSTKDSWLMKDNIMLLPGYIAPPVDKSKFSEYDLGYIVEGEFESYFKGKEIPVITEKNDVESKEDKKKSLPKKNRNIVEFSGQLQSILTKGKPGKIMVIGSSAMIRNNLINNTGSSVNSVFILNLIDYINDRGDWAIMRGKNQRNNQIRPSTAEDGILTNHSYIKYFNMIVLPILICLSGLFSYYIRSGKRKKLENLFL